MISNMCLIYTFLGILIELIVKNLVLFICLYYLGVLLRRLQAKNINPDGRAVLITGCASGFGYELALRLNKIGFKVYATVRSIERPGSQLLKQNAVFPNNMIVYQMDISNEVNEVFESVRNDLQNSGQQLWALVNNAGISRSSQLEWGSIDNYYKVFETNVFGTVRVTRTFLPLIRESEGRIIIINSVLGRFSVKLSGIYCMSKHALVAFSDTLRRELSKFNVKVCSIEPGLFKTQISDPINLGQHLKEIWNQSSDEIKKSYPNIKINLKYLDTIKKFVPFSLNIDIVIDDIIDSIMNYRPKIVYRPIDGLKSKIMSWILIYLPDSFLDCCDKLHEHIVNNYL